MYNRKMYSVLMVLALLSAGFLGLLAIPSGNLVEPAEADSTRAFEGGDGTIGNPYQISDVFQLQEMNISLDAHYVLINDIDASATSGWNSDAGFEPIGDDVDKFMGSLDGQGYDITDLFINRTATYYVGLFGYLDTGARLSNISLIENHVDGKRYAGGLVGYNNGGSVSNCYATGNVSGDEYIGGLVGYNNGGSVSNCYATGNVSGDDYLGGLLGKNSYGTVSNCSTSGSVNGRDYIGGLAGEHYQGMISDCYTTGSVGGFGDQIGGLVGYNVGPVSNCYSTSIVTGTHNVVGGLVGKSLATVTNCYATGSVSGIGRVGGLVGSIDGAGSVSNCFATGSVTGTGKEIGGLVGYNSGPASNCYASGDVSGTGNQIGGLAGYSDKMVSNCYATGNVSGTGDYFGGLVGDNRGSISNCYATGSVTGVSDIGGLVGLISGAGSVSNCSASGDVNGINGYAGGLVGHNVDRAVENCFATGSVTGDYDYVGGLIGANRGSILNCYATGTLSGKYYVGGLVGYISGTSIVSNCYATGSVSGDSDYVGGLIGVNSQGLLSNCYATGSVSGADEVGGLVGINSGPVENCYATGNVSGTGDNIGGLMGDNARPVSNCYATGSVTGTGVNIGGLVGTNSNTATNCFWDTETSGMATSDGGTGKTTSEMKQEVTFTGAEWNFDDTWSIWDGKTYPYLNNLTYPSPIIATMDVINGVEDQVYLVEYAGESFLPGCTDLTWEIDTDADWLAISTEGVLTGTPGNNDVGNHSVEVICNDPRLVSTTRIFTLSVLNTNDAPEINLTYANATEDVLYSMVLSAIDIDPTEDTLTWALESGPTWLELNTTTNTLNGTPLNSDVGINEVNVSVDDGNGGSDWQNFTITVENTNDDPIIITTPMNTTLQDLLYSVTLNATDEDPVAINFTWSMDTNADWLELNGTYLNGTPGNFDVGTFWVNITVTDGYGGSHSLNYTLIVNNVNDAPLWTITPIDQNITEGEALTIECAARDIDGDDITYSIETTPTSDITIDSETGVISWASPAVGTYSVTITATDGALEIQHTFSLTVYAPGEGPEPVENKTDTDGDGMPDEWEEAHGLDPNDASDATLDPDGDGISNLDEYKQGSDPLVNESVDGSTDADDKRSFAGFCLIAGIIGIILLLIMVVIVVIVAKSRKGQTDSLEE